MDLHRHLHDLELGVAADHVLAQLPVNLTLSSEDGVLSLYDPVSPQSKLAVDFVQGALSYRSQQHLGAENLIKACQIKGQRKIKLLDGTCGLGTDSFLLHQAGFQVTAVEKNLIIYALLKDGIQRYSQQTGEVCFGLKPGDFAAQSKLHSCDVVYLDPMFPSKAKSAKNKKVMQLFQLLHHSATDDAVALLNLAMTMPCERVVIKRPTKSPLLTNFKPTFQIIGKTCRFDAYQLK